MKYQKGETEVLSIVTVQTTTTIDKEKNRGKKNIILASEEESEDQENDAPNALNIKRVLSSSVRCVVISDNCHSLNSTERWTTDEWEKDS